MNFFFFEYMYVCIGVFVGPMHSKPKKQLKTKFYKQTPWKLKLMKFEKKTKLTYKMELKLEKTSSSSTPTQSKKRAIPIWKAR